MTATEDIIQVAVRLKETVADGEAQNIEHGLDDGRMWAREHATLRELGDLLERSPRDLSFAEGHSLHWLFTETLDHDYLVQLPEDTFEIRGEVITFGWNSYTEAFIDGAREIYDAARPHL